MHYGRRRVTLPVLIAEFQECVIMNLEFNMGSTTTRVTDCIRPNKPWFQFKEHVNGYLDMEISFLKFLE